MHNRLGVAITFAAVVWSVSGPAARAQGYAPVAPTPSGPVPAFALLDRTSGESKVHVGFGYSFFDEDSGLFGDISTQRVDVHGQFVHPETGFGGYGVLNYGRLSAMDASDDGLGNIELGGLYQLQGQMPVTLRAGLGIGSADEDDALIVAFSGLHRLSDFAVNFTDTTTVRLSASPMMRQGQVFFRLDAGIDIPIDDSDELDVDAIGRISGGVGVDVGQVAVMAELLNIAALGGDEDLDLGERFIHLVGAGARYTGHPVFQPGLTVAVPVDEDLRELFQFTILLNAEILIPTGPSQPQPLPAQ